MNIFNDWRTLSLIGTVLALLGVSTVIVQVLKRRQESGIDAAILLWNSTSRRLWLLPTTRCPESDLESFRNRRVGAVGGASPE